MSTNPLDHAACLALAQRQVGSVGTDGWTPADWAAQLTEDAQARGDPPQLYYRPYRTALAYLSLPGLVKARTEGDVSEQYADLGPTLRRLEALADEWDAEKVPPLEAEADAGEWSAQIDWGSW